jgi:hypothetical protein
VTSTRGLIVDPPTRRHAQMPTANTASDHEPRVAHMARQSSYGGPSRTTTSSALLPPDRHPTPHGRTYGTAQNDTVAASYTTLTASPKAWFVACTCTHHHQRQGTNPLINGQRTPLLHGSESSPWSAQPHVLVQCMCTDSYSVLCTARGFTTVHYIKFVNDSTSIRLVGRLSRARVCFVTV